MLLVLLASFLRLCTPTTSVFRSGTVSEIPDVYSAYYLPIFNVHAFGLYLMVKATSRRGASGGVARRRIHGPMSKSTDKPMEGAMYAVSL